MAGSQKKVVSPRATSPARDARASACHAGLTAKRYTTHTTATVGGPHGVGVSLKLAAGAAIVGLIAADNLLPPLALAGGLAAVLAAVIFVEGTMLKPWQTD